VEARPRVGWEGYVHGRIAAPPAPLAGATAALAGPAAWPPDLLEEAPVGLMQVAEDGTVRRINRTLASWLGSTPADLAAAAPRLHDLLGAPPPDMPPYAVAPERGDEAATGTLSWAGGPAVAASFRQVFRREGGRIVSADIFVLDTGRFQQQVTGLAQTVHRLQSLFDHAPIGVAVVDAGLRISDCNPTFVRMSGQDDIVGRSLPDLLDPASRPPALSRKEGLAGVGALPPMEIRFGGGGAVAQLYVSPVEADGSPGYALHAVDMTDQKKLEAQFVQSQKMQAIGQLAGGVAHDFNNLLTAMIGFCDLLLLRHKPGDQSFSDIMQIKQNANRAANLVRQLLAFSRQQTLQPRVLNVTDVLAELSHLLRRLIGENIEFKMMHGRDLGPVKVDQGQLEQVIINLVVNARDAMPEGGRLTIATRNYVTPGTIRWGSEEMPPGSYVVIEVADTGIGIPKENLERIFEPFFSTKEVGAGTGLGLSTVYGIVRQTGGFVFVASAPGEGARFSIYLPRHDVQQGAEPAATGDKAERTADLTGAGTVLLVEDEDAVRVFSARALRNKGYHVMEAKTGEAAMELLKKSEGVPIDLVITDVVMPQMDGPTLIRNLRPLRPDVKVIYISGYTEDRFRNAVDDGAAIEFLPKPFSLKQLAAKVKEVMGGS
jgi:two-component system cell cycle sensor histidine kinase/response regulator CckA